MSPSSTSLRLEELKGSHPIILLFAPSDRSPAYENQVALLEEESGLAQAGVMLARIFTDGDSYLDDRKLEPASVDQLRSQFHIDDDMFLLVLIGRDGAEKMRDDAPLQPAVIFERISDSTKSNV